MELLSKKSQNLNDIDGIVSFYNRLQRKTILDIQRQLQQALNLEKDSERQHEVNKLAQNILAIASRLTYLTPLELEQIAQLEQQRGYLFLDTLIKIIPQMYETVAIAREVHNNLISSGFARTHGIDAKAINQRELVLGNLIYGGKDNTAQRGIADVIKRSHSPIRKATWLKK